MKTKYQWIISAVERKIKTNELEKVITAIHYRLQATRENISAEMYSLIQLSEPSLQNFTPYEELTKKQIINWIEILLGNELILIKENLEKELNEKENPITDVVLNPFNNENI
jgi:hypothetical protein